MICPTYQRRKQANSHPIPALNHTFNLLNANISIHDADQT